MKNIHGYKVLTFTQDFLYHIYATGYGEMAELVEGARLEIVYTL